MMKLPRGDPSGRQHRVAGRASAHAAPGQPLFPEHGGPMGDSKSKPAATKPAGDKPHKGSKSGKGK